jgi:hypothetical protein
METIFEQLLATYLTLDGKDGKVFIIPQYEISMPGSGWKSYPDFVALDFGKRDVVVVKVTTGGSVAAIVDRVKKRDSQWFQPLGAKLRADGVVERALWSPHG